MQTRLSLSRKSMTPAKKRLPNYIECESGSGLVPESSQASSVMICGKL